MVSLAALHPHIWRWILQVFALGVSVGLPIGWALGEPIDLAAAVASAKPGATIELPEGTYAVPPGGLRIADKPGLVLRAAPGARPILVPQRVSPAWEPVEGAPGVYRAPQILGSGIYRPDGRWVIYARDRALFDSIARDGIDVALRGVGETLISLGGEDPRTTDLWVGASEAATLVCDRSSGMRVEGLEFRYANGEAILLRAGCDRAAIVANEFVGGRFAVRAFDPQLQDVSIEGNRVQGPRRHPRQCYRDEKGTPLIEGGAFFVPGIRPLIVRNRVVDTFDGISLFCRNCSTVDPLIEGNELERVHDDVFELDGAVVRGLVQANRARGFVVFSFSPRVAPTGEDTVIRGNAVEAMQPWACFDRTGATTGEANVTKFNGAQATNLVFEGNALHGVGHVIRGAVGATGPYPARVRWRGNLIHSRFGPLVRFPGLAADGNVLEGNAYVLEVPSGAAISAWNQAPGSPVNYATLAAARSSSAGQAAGWEGQGVQLLTLDAVPSGAFPSLEARRPAAPVGARIEP